MSHRHPPAKTSSHSLNIEIPPTAVARSMEIDAQHLREGNPGVSQVASRQVELQFAERALLPIRLVRLRYTRSPAGTPVIDIRGANGCRLLVDGRRIRATYLAFALAGLLHRSRLR